MNRTHGYTFVGGAVSGAALVTGRPWLVAAALAGMFLLGLLTGGLLLYASRIGRRVVDRFDNAMPDRRDGFGFRGMPPLSEDPDYLDGQERGRRSARRSAGHEDGRLAELSELEGRDFP